MAARSKPDSYTFLISAAGVISNSMIKKTLPYRNADLIPVAMVSLAPSVILVPADAPHNNLKEFIAASQKGQGFRWATAGTGRTPHFVCGILQTQYGAKLDIVPYKSGSESITAVIGKQVEASIIALRRGAFVAPHILGQPNSQPVRHAGVARRRAGRDRHASD